MASTVVGGHPSAAIAAMMRKKLGGGDVDDATLEQITQSASAKKTVAVDKVGQEVKLTHMTKGRAKGPKRRLPTTTAQAVENNEKQSPEMGSTRSIPASAAKPVTIAPLSAKSHSFPSGPRSSLVSERLAMFSGSDSGSREVPKNGSTSVAKTYQVPMTTSVASKSATTFNTAADKPKPATPAKPAFGVIKSGDKARPVSLIFPPTKSSEHEHVDQIADQEPTYKPRPVIPGKPKLQTLRGSSYSAVVSTRPKEGEATGPLKKMQSLPLSSPTPKPKPESLMRDRHWDTKSAMTSATAAAPKPPFKSTPQLKVNDVKAKQAMAETSLNEKQQPMLRPKPVSIVKSVFESKEKAADLSSTSWRSPSKPEPAKKPPIFHSRSKSYGGRSNIERPTLPPKPKALFSRYNTGEEEKVEDRKTGAVVHDHEMPAKSPASKLQPVSFLLGGRPAGSASEVSFSEPKTKAVRIPPKPLLEATERPRPATIPRMSDDMSSAPTQNIKPPLPSKPKSKWSTVVRDPPILSILPKPAVREHEPVVPSKISVRDRVSNWGVASSTTSKGSTTITMLRAQTPLVS
ncbi:hypothetical protein V1509DRAFT_135316 [Lipomyces kononenkoae]